MRRDMELVRLLLLDIEGEESPDLSKYSEDQRGYHLEKMIEADLVKGTVKKVPTRNERGWEYYILPNSELTWEGHDFLDAAKNQTVWKKAMGKVKESGGVVAFDVLKALLIAYGKDLVGLP